MFFVLHYITLLLSQAFLAARLMFSAKNKLRHCNLTDHMIVSLI